MLRGTVSERSPSAEHPPSSLTSRDTEPTSFEALPRRRIGRYAIVERLGVGAYGAVFRARDEALDRDVAIKVLRDAVEPGSETLARFEREGRACGRLSHPGIVRIHSVGVHEGQPYIAMELVRGRALDDVIAREGRLKPERAARLFSDVADALAHAHDHGVLHRDVKPANIILDADGRARLTDFGLARDETVREELTATGETLGSPAYMSPEQCVAGPVGPASDIHSVGASLYEALTGRLPFEGASAMAAMMAVIGDQPDPVRAHAPDVPAAIEEVTLRCLAKDPGERFASASALAAALRDAARPTRRVDSAPGLFAATAAIVAVLLLVGLAMALVGRRGAGFPPAPPGSTAAAAAAAAAGRAPSALAPPPPGEGWRLAWRLGAGEGPRLDPPELWTDGGGLEADPSRAWREGEALSSAFAGKARSLGGGRIAVIYDVLGAASRPEAKKPGLLLRNGRPSAIRLQPGRPGPEGGSSTRLAVDNDVDVVFIRVGRARWLEPRISFSFRRSSEVDLDAFGVQLGSDRESRLSFEGRSGRAAVGRESVPFSLGDVWHGVTFAPAAPPGERVVLDGQPVPALDIGAAAPTAPTPILLRINEADMAFTAVEVEGTPRRPDVPASAETPTEALSISARVAASFVRSSDDPGDGGPFVALGDRDGERITLELDRHDLVLRVGDQLIASAEVTRADLSEGWLTLERRADLVTARARLGEVGRSVLLEGATPAPLRIHQVRTFYGSTAPAVRFRDVTVHDGGGDRGDARASLDRAAASGALAPVDDARPARSPVEGWRRGARLLAAVTDPHEAAPEHFGGGAGAGPGREPDAVHDAAAARRAIARRAVTLLEGAAAELEGVARADALARAVLAAVVTRDAEAAVRLADELVRSVGATEARTRVDHLRTDPVDGRPALVRRLGAGWGVLSWDPETAHAALEAADVLAGDDDEAHASVLFHRAALTFARSEGPGRPPDPAAIDEALDLLDRADALGHSIARIESKRASLHEAAGRPRDALAAWRRFIDHEPGHYTAWQRRSHLAEGLDRRDEALGSMLRALGVAARLSAKLLLDLSQREADRDRPARALTGRWSFILRADEAGITIREEARLDLLRQAEQLDQASPKTREGDLARWVRATAGTSIPADRLGSGPVGDVVRARALVEDDRDGARRLIRAVDDGDDELARALLRLDDELRPLLAQDGRR